MSEYIYEHKPSGSDHMGKPVELPTLVQREEIVRCRDCKFYQPDMYKYFTCECLQQWATPDDFCAWAKEKKGLNNDSYNYNDKHWNIEHCNDQHGKCCN